MKYKVPGDANKSDGQTPKLLDALLIVTLGQNIIIQYKFAKK